jgi:Cu+-exporting ATPase
MEVLPAEGALRERLLGVAAAAESLTSHPLGKAVSELAAGERITLPAATGLKVHPGAGLAAAVEGQPAIVGHEQFLAEQGVSLPSHLADQLQHHRQSGATALLVAHAGRYLGAILVADPIAPHSAEAVRSLQNTGLRVVMVTGDKDATARAVAQQVGIREVRAETKPDEKQQIVRELQAAGGVVAMVGDGINDAPALAAADLGIAIGAGADVAIETADIVLVQPDLRSLVRALELARSTLAVIYQNLAWAFGYNLLLLPLATGLFAHWLGLEIPPVAAAAAMAASSVSVVLNSLRLRWA